MNSFQYSTRYFSGGITLSAFKSIEAIGGNHYGGNHRNMSAEDEARFARNNITLLD